MPEILIIPRELKKLTFSPKTWDLHLSKFQIWNLEISYFERTKCVHLPSHLFEKPKMIEGTLVSLL